MANFAETYDTKNAGTGKTLTPSGTVTTVSGGYSNTAGFSYSTVAGGYFNTASGDYSAVAGGAFNTASGVAAFVGGGANNLAGGDYSVVLGSHGQTFATGSFVFSDGNGQTFYSGLPNEFIVGATGGIGMYTAKNYATGQFVRDTLDGCIGCGCLSLKRCALYNRDDRAARTGAGPRYALGVRWDALP